MNTDELKHTPNININIDELKPMFVIHKDLCRHNIEDRTINIRLHVPEKEGVQEYNNQIDLIFSYGFIDKGKLIDIPHSQITEKDIEKVICILELPSVEYKRDGERASGNMLKILIDEAFEDEGVRKQLEFDNKTIVQFYVGKYFDEYKSINFDGHYGK